MKHRWWLLFVMPAIVAASCAAAESAATTNGPLALRNLDQLIEQQGSEPASLELLLLRMQFTADYRVLDRIEALTAEPPLDGPTRLRHAQARAAAHRFADALEELDRAERDGVPARLLQSRRASVLVATGHAAQALPALQDQAARRPGFATLCSLARAYAALGRLDAADTLYAQALRDLDTTSPFPYAAVAFARGQMWSEQGGDTGRGAELYRQALRAMPDYPAANVHLAEIEIANGELSAAGARLQRIAAASDEPEAVALLGALHVRQGRREAGRAEIAHARWRYEILLSAHPQAFADHAAEFYLGAGRDAKRAWYWASVNLRERQTRRAYALAIRAARAHGLSRRAYKLEQTMNAQHSKRAA